MTKPVAVNTGLALYRAARENNNNNNKKYYSFYYSYYLSTSGSEDAGVKYKKKQKTGSKGYVSVPIFNWDSFME